MMLTKEQCLSEELNPQSSAIDLGNPHLRDAIFYGMQLYAKELSIELNKFCFENTYQLSSKPDLYYFHISSKFSPCNRQPINAEQLFELFLQSINQK